MTLNIDLLWTLMIYVKIWPNMVFSASVLMTLWIMALIEEINSTGSKPVSGLF